MSAPGPVSVSSGGVVAPPSPASAPPSIAAASVPGATSSVGSSPTADLPGMLLRKVAHDIVGPTGVAAGALKELERTFGEEKSAHASMMNLAFRSLQRLERLAKRLRLTALIQDGGLELESAVIEVEPSFAAAVAGATTLDGRKNIAVDGPQVAGELRVRADEEHLVLILGELASNSLRFARKAIKLRAAREGDVVAFTFEDDGPGYPPGLPAALRQGRAGLSRESGLALPIVDAIAQRFGGRLVLGPSSLSSAKDNSPGASARLELPAEG